MDKDKEVTNVSDVSDASDRLCTDHHKSFKYICRECNLLRCYVGMDQHLKQYHNHKYDHVDDIRDSLSIDRLNIIDNNNNSLNNSISTGSQYKMELEQIWSFIKSSSDHLKTLQSKDNEITSHFQVLYQYLRDEEMKLKKPIRNDINSINNQINLQINHLQSLINIINLNNSNNDESNSSKETDELNGPISNQIILESIEKTESLQQFIKNNIFNHDNDDDSDDDISNNNNNNIDFTILDLIYNHNRQYHSTSSSSIYNINIDKLLLNKNYSITVNSNIDSIKQRLQQVISDSIQLQKLHKQMKSITLNDKIISGSIQLDFKHAFNQQQHSQDNGQKDQKQEQLIDQRSLEQQTTDQQTVDKPIVILSTHSRGTKATLFEISDHNNRIKTEEIYFPYKNSATFNSFIRVGEFVYIFGGYNNSENNHGNTKYCRYSIKEKKIENMGVITGVSGADEISVCYSAGNSNSGNSSDGDYIYLINGYNEDQYSYLMRIDRMDLKTEKFERYHYSTIKGIVCLSFMYKGLLYSVPAESTQMLVNIFNPVTKTDEPILDNSLQLLFNSKTASCTNGNGSIYILSSNKKFIRYNVETKQVDYLQSLDRLLEISFNFYLSMVYSNNNSNNNNNNNNNNSTFIYLFGGSEYGNFYYSVEKDEWYRMDQDLYNRRTCGSVLIS